MKSGCSLEAYDDAKHGGIIASAALGGTDISETPGATERYLAYGKTEFGYGPVCLFEIIGTEYVAEPHVTWFPWVTPANKIVNFKWAMLYLSKTREVMINVEKSQKSFFEHFVKKGMLRKVGYLENLPIVEEIHMYQYKRGEE